METLETRSERITARITPRQKKLITQAAALRGRSLTDFMIDSAQKEAEKAINEGLVIRLTSEHQQRLFELLSNPPEANEALKKAAQAYEDAEITRL